jgi:hypothetical protein
LNSVTSIIRYNDIENNLYETKIVFKSGKTVEICFKRL